MEIKVTKITDASLIRDAASCTSGRKSHITLAKAYRSEHSIIRTQLFKVEMRDIPTFVSVHFVRHKVGVEHFVKSNREDRGGNGQADRNTPVDHIMLVNAQALLAMAHARLCSKAHPSTREVMGQIVMEVSKADPDLGPLLVPRCVYRGGICGEPKSCGYNRSELFQKALAQYRALFS